MWIIGKANSKIHKHEDSRSLFQKASSSLVISLSLTFFKCEWTETIVRCAPLERTTGAWDHEEANLLWHAHAKVAKGSISSKATAN